jgi:hypothetical protein
LNRRIMPEAERDRRHRPVHQRLLDPARPGPQHLMGVERAHCAARIRASWNYTVAKKYLPPIPSPPRPFFRLSQKKRGAANGAPKQKPGFGVSSCDRPRESRGETGMASELPHERVWVRLGLSNVHGIGVFAIRPIPEGTSLFANDPAPIRWVEVAALDQAGLGEAERRFYEDFGIRRGGRIGCPPNFNLLTPSWYLNEPPAGAEPNVRSAADFTFYAARDIDEGEELLIDYASFSAS